MMSSVPALSADAEKYTAHKVTPRTFSANVEHGKANIINCDDDVNVVERFAAYKKNGGPDKNTFSLPPVKSGYQAHVKKP